MPENSDQNLSLTSKTRYLRHVYTVNQIGVEKDHWPAFDSSFDNYVEDFKALMTKEEVLAFLGNRETPPTIIDFMSSPSAMKDLTRQLSIPGTKAISVGLTDPRSEHEKEVDARDGIFHVKGDVIFQKSWDDVKKELGGKPADLIVERGIAGLYRLPNRADFYNLMLRELWKILNPNGGIMILEIPDAQALSEAGISMIKVKDLISKNGIQIEHANGRTTDSDFIKITKTPESPTRFPILNSQNE